MDCSNSINHNKVQVLSYSKYSLLCLPVVRIEPVTSRWFHLEVHHHSNTYICYATYSSGQFRGIFLVFINIMLLSIPWITTIMYDFFKNFIYFPYKFLISLHTIPFWCSSSLTFSGWNVSPLYILLQLPGMEYMQFLVMLYSVGGLTQKGHFWRVVPLLNIVLISYMDHTFLKSFWLSKGQTDWGEFLGIVLSYSIQISWSQYDAL